MTRQAENTGCNWYAIHTYSGYEDAVRNALLQRIENMNMQDYIFDVVVPKEKQVVIKKGEKKIEEKKLFPGYVLVKMMVTDKSWFVVRNTPNVTGFVGSGTIPVPVSAEEFGVVQKRMGEAEPKVKIPVEIGENVVITEGPFANYEGGVSKIDENRGKITMLISMFGRETPVELDVTQIKKK